MASARPPIPDGFTCPITHAVCEDPVICADGNTYERTAIQYWLQQPRGTDPDTGLPRPPRSPLTNSALLHVELVPNRALKSAIAAWFAHYPDMRVKSAKMHLDDVRAAVDALEREAGGKRQSLRAQVQELEGKVAERDETIGELKKKVARLEQKLCNKNRKLSTKRDIATPARNRGAALPIVLVAEDDDKTSPQETRKILMTPIQPYKPEQAYNDREQVLPIDESLTQTIELVLYNSGNSGWSYGKAVADGPTVARGQQGWFPTICCSVDVVTTVYTFDTKPEATRPYISFQPGQRIVVDKRHDCGWWTGAVIEDEQHGNLGVMGFFPGNHCREL